MWTFVIIEYIFWFSSVLIGSRIRLKTFCTSHSRFIYRNKNEILLEQVHMSSPRLHPVVLSLLDPEEQKESSLCKNPHIRLWKLSTLTAGWWRLGRSVALSGSVFCKKRSWTRGFFVRRLFSISLKLNIWQSRRSMSATYRKSFQMYILTSHTYFK